MSFINLNPKLHIDLLKSQYAVFSIVHKRICKDRPLSQDSYVLGYQLQVLKLYLIIEEENEKRRQISLD
jgi:hypothetical protein